MVKATHARIAKHRLALESSRLFCFVRSSSIRDRATAALLLLQISVLLHHIALSKNRSLHGSGCVASPTTSGERPQRGPLWHAYEGGLDLYIEAKMFQSPWLVVMNKPAARAPSCWQSSQGSRGALH